MQSRRAPIFVFFAAFLTFMIAFAFLLVMLKPMIDKRRQEAAAVSEGTPSVASVAPGAGHPPAAAPKDGTDKKAHKTPDKPSKDGPWEVEFCGRVVDARGEVPRDAMVHLLAPATDRKSDRFHHLASAPVDATGHFKLAAKVSQPAVFLQAVAAACVRSERKGFAPGTVPRVETGDLVVRPGFTVRVRVAAEDFSPLGGAQVRLVDATNDPEPIKRRAQETRSEADGSAVLRGVDSGAYSVQVSATGHADAWSSLSIDGASEGDSTVSVTLPKCTSWVFGNAFDPRHNAITSGEVVVRMVHPKPSAEQTWRAPIQAGGAFKVGPVPKGTFEVDIGSTGLVQTGHVLAESDGEAVELVCEQGGVVAGRLQVPVTQLSQPPKISLLRRDDKGHLQPFDGAFRCEADPVNLRFRIDGLGPGTYVVRVFADGFAPSRSAPFELTLGKPVDGLLLQLGEGAEVAGRLVDARGAPLARARVTAFEGLSPPPPALQELFPADARQIVFSGDDGRFTLSALSPGTQTFVVEMQGQPPRMLGPLLVDEKHPTKLGELTLGGGAILSVTLHDAAGQPVPQSAARLARKDGAIELRCVADEQGNCCLRGLAPGAFTLATDVDGGERTDVQLRSGDTKHVDLSLPKR